jgi:hypothetical protein
MSALMSCPLTQWHARANDKWNLVQHDASGMLPICYRELGTTFTTADKTK